MKKIAESRVRLRETYEIDYIELAKILKLPEIKYIRVNGSISDDPSALLIDVESFHD